jgi:DinB superfamily
MAELSNRFDRTVEESGQYVQGVLGLLAERDPLEVLGELLPVLEEVTAAFPEPLLRRPERAGKWSIAQVIAHLADSDLVTGYRLRLVVAQPGAAIQGYDQDRWAAELRYAEAPLAETLDQLRALRGANLRLLRWLDPERLARAGLHSERGRETVGQLMRLYAGHDLVHRRQIERIRRAVVT